MIRIGSSGLGRGRIFGDESVLKILKSPHIISNFHQDEYAQVSPSHRCQKMRANQVATVRLNYYHEGSKSAVPAGTSTSLVK